MDGGDNRFRRQNKSSLCPYWIFHHVCVRWRVVCPEFEGNRVTKNLEGVEVEDFFLLSKFCTVQLEVLSRLT